MDKKFSSTQAPFFWNRLSLYNLTSTFNATRGYHNGLRISPQEAGAYLRLIATCLVGYICVREFFIFIVVPYRISSDLMTYTPDRMSIARRPSHSTSASCTYVCGRSDISDRQGLVRSCHSDTAFISPAQLPRQMAKEARVTASRFLPASKLTGIHGRFL